MSSVGVQGITLHWMAMLRRHLVAAELEVT